MKFKNGEKMKIKDLKYETKKYIYIYDFQQYETIRSCGGNIYTIKINVDEADMDQSNLVEFDNKSRPRTIEVKIKKRYF